MKDPFDLLPPAPEFDKKEVAKPIDRRNFLVFGLITLFIVGFFIALTIYKKDNVSANIDDIRDAKIGFAGMPDSVAVGDRVSLNVSINPTSDLKSSSIFVYSDGADFVKSIDVSKDLQKTDPGFTRALDKTELEGLPKGTSSGVYIYLGDLTKEKEKLQQVAFKSLSVSDDSINVYAKLFTGKKVKYNCGTLNLSVCTKMSGDELVVQNSTSLNLRKSISILTKPGYNFITLPYVFAPSASDEFLSNIKVKWASIYDSKKLEYVDLLKAGNAQMIRPGMGFWIFDEKGGDYPLPKDKVEVNYNEPFTLSLEEGYNQIGNPYAKRIVFSGEKILIREVGTDGSPTGAMYSLKVAIENGTLSKFSIVENKPFTDSNAAQNDIAQLIGYKDLSLESTILPYTAMVTKATKKVNIIFPAKEIIAAGDLMEEKEKKQIEDWILKSGLNQYGDTQNTIYSGGTPLINSSTNQMIDRYDYIITKHTDRPWKTSN